MSPIKGGNAARNDFVRTPAYAVVGFGGRPIGLIRRHPAARCGKGPRSHVQLYLDRTGGLVVRGGEGLRNLRERELVRHHPLQVDPA